MSIYCNHHHLFVFLSFHHHLYHRICLSYTFFCLPFHHHHICHDVCLFASIASPRSQSPCLRHHTLPHYNAIYLLQLALTVKEYQLLVKLFSAKVINTNSNTNKIIITVIVSTYFVQDSFLRNNLQIFIIYLAF